MDILTPGYSLDEFFDRARKSSKRILMLDYDGTLAPFRVERDRAYPYPGVRERLIEIQADPATRLIIVSGRAADDVRPLLGVNPSPEIWGSHGAERYLPGQGVRLMNIPDSIRRGLAAIISWVEENGLEDAVEKKPTGIAFHFRAYDEAAAGLLAEKIKSTWTDKIGDFGLEMREFDGGIELRALGIGKGDAVKSILDEAGDAVFAYLGDDFTDEDAFRALGDGGLRVLVRTELRDTLADIHLTPPAELLDFLDRWRFLSRPQE